MILDPQSLLDYALFDYVEDNIQPNSYDLRLNRVFQICGGIKLYADGRKELPPYRELEPDGKEGTWFQLRTGNLYQLEFLERVRIPANATAITIMRSSMSKSGASGETGLYDSGYKGNCGMTVSVKHSCHIEHKAAVAQIVFMTARSTRLYEGDYLDQKWLERLVVSEEGTVNADR